MTFNDWLRDWLKKNPSWEDYLSCRIAEYEEPDDSWSYRSWPVLTVGDAEFDESEATELMKVLEKFLELPVE